MLKDTAKITSVSGSKYALIPSTIFTDSCFPFKEDDELDVEVVGNKLIYKKHENKN